MSSPESGGGDEFDRIVEHLDLDLSFPDEDTQADEDPTDEELAQRRAEIAAIWTRGPDPVEDEHFYRRVDMPARQLRLGLLLAWSAIVAAPLVMTLATLSAYILPRSVLVALTLLFLAGAIYLINQLPDRGPADPDSPDDGAVL